MPYRSSSTATTPYDHPPRFGPMGTGILRALSVTKLVGKSFTASSPNGCEPNAMPDGVVLPCSRLLSICYYITHVFPVTPGVTGKKIARNTATEVGPTW